MLINRMDLTKLGQMEPEQLHEEVARLASSLLAQEDTPLSSVERERLIDEVRHELFGLDHSNNCWPTRQSPTSWLTRPTTSTSSVAASSNDQIDFKDNEHLMRVIERIVSSVGRRIDESSPMVDARLNDGSRVNAIIPPLSLDGPVLSIRRFGAEPLRMNR